MTGRTFRLVEDVSSYARLSSGPGTVPVLAPDDAGRRSRWEKVLDWYGQLDDGCPSADGSADVVVVVDPDFEAPARVLAGANGRSLLVVSSPGEATEIAGRPRSVTLLGRSTRFTRSTIEVLAAGMTAPWGVLCARDLPGITFVVAKALAVSARSRRAVGVADTTRDRWTLHDEAGWPRSSGQLIRLRC